MVIPLSSTLILHAALENSQVQVFRQIAIADRATFGDLYHVMRCAFELNAEQDEAPWHFCQPTSPAGEYNAGSVAAQQRLRTVLREEDAQVNLHYGLLNFSLWVAAVLPADAPAGARCVGGFGSLSGRPWNEFMLHRLNARLGHSAVGQGGVMRRTQ